MAAIALLLCWTGSRECNQSRNASFRYLRRSAKRAAYTRQEKLSRYSVEWQPDERHLARVGNPRLFGHPYHSAQLELWEAGAVEWFVIIRAESPVRRREQKRRVLLVQWPRPLKEGL